MVEQINERNLCYLLFDAPNVLVVGAGSVRRTASVHHFALSPAVLTLILISWGPGRSGLRYAHESITDGGLGLLQRAGLTEHDRGTGSGDQCPW